MVEEQFVTSRETELEEVTRSYKTASGNYESQTGLVSEESVACNKEDLIPEFQSPEMREGKLGLSPFNSTALSAETLVHEGTGASEDLKTDNVKAQVEIIESSSVSVSQSLANESEVSFESKPDLGVKPNLGFTPNKEINVEIVLPSEAHADYETVEPVGVNATQNLINQIASNVTSTTAHDSVGEYSETLPALQAGVPSQSPIMAPLTEETMGMDTEGALKTIKPTESTASEEYSFQQSVQVSEVSSGEREVDYKVEEDSSTQVIQ
jgi:hypothetical protein